MQVHELIKSYRNANDLTQEEMGEKLNMTEQTYGRMERGETAMTENKINAFAKLLDKTPREIREMAEKGQLFPLVQENENHGTLETGQIGHLTIHNYYGDQDLSLQIEHLNSLLAEKDKLLATKDEQIATLKLLVESLQK